MQVSVDVLIQKFFIVFLFNAYLSLPLSLNWPKGYATLSLSIEGPSKAEIECTDNNDGTCTVSYCPTEPGIYLVNVRYADQHVPGSPFTIQVGGEASARMVQRIVRSRHALETTQVGSKCGLTMRIPGNSFIYSHTQWNLLDIFIYNLFVGDIRGISAEVISPSGQRIQSEIVPIDNEQFTIRFVPLETGIHTVSILNRGVHIPGKLPTVSMEPKFNGQ